MPVERFGPDDSPEFWDHAGRERLWKDPGFQAKRERIYAEGQDAATHADKWLEGTKHLHDPETLKKAQKLLSYGKRGILSSEDVNTEMNNIFPGIYPEFDPADTPFNIPDHLGEQFR